MKFTVLTEHPIAAWSVDTTQPGGTMHDNSRNHRFNDKLYAHFGSRKLLIADLGCAGGGFVKDCIDDGHEAVGLEGSDYSLVRKRAEWATIPDNLFTADVTEPFTVMRGVWDYDDRNEEYFDGKQTHFDCVTAWEVMEHIPEERLPGLCDNVRRHLAPGGIWVMSVSKQHGPHHVCVHDRAWWQGLFAREGFVEAPEVLGLFGLEDWVRGPLQNAPESFHFVLRVRDSERGAE